MRHQVAVLTQDGDVTAFATVPVIWV